MTHNNGFTEARKAYESLLDRCTAGVQRSPSEVLDYCTIMENSLGTDIRLRGHPETTRSIYTRIEMLRDSANSRLEDLKKIAAERKRKADQPLDI